MSIKRREFINLAAMSTATGLLTTISSCNSNEMANEKKSKSGNLQSMMKDVVPITVKERESRIEKAQRLLSENKIQALICWNIHGVFHGDQLVDK